MTNPAGKVADTVLPGYFASHKATDRNKTAVAVDVAPCIILIEVKEKESNIL